MSHGSRPVVNGLDHVAIRVADVQKSIRWYRQILGLQDAFPGEWDGIPVMMFAAGSNGAPGTGIALFPAHKGGENAGDAPTGVDHYAFRVSAENFKAYRSHLRRVGIDFDEQDHELACSLYFLDPDNNTVEITTYPGCPDPSR